MVLPLDTYVLVNSHNESFLQNAYFDNSIASASWSQVLELHLVLFLPFLPSFSHMKKFIIILTKLCVSSYSQTLNITTAHSHMTIALACTAHHPSRHPLHACKIRTNPRPLHMPYNCALFRGSLLLLFILAAITSSNSNL